MYTGVYEIMKACVITIAGVSSRFNEGFSENERCHKAIFHYGDKTNTLLFHLLKKCLNCDVIVLVCGYLYDDIRDYCEYLPDEMRCKIKTVYNLHYEDLASGYSLYMGLDYLFENYSDIDAVLFIEGDLDIDEKSFRRIALSGRNVLTYNYDPIFAKKAVALYKNADCRYKYAFNSNHGLLHIDESFSEIYNSGQIWQFVNMKRLKYASDKFYIEDKGDTNLRIISNYIDLSSKDEFDLIGIKCWTNCNTREDYDMILKRWENEE